MTELQKQIAEKKAKKDFEDNAPEQTPDYIDFCNKEGKYTPIKCSLEQDNEWANESI